MAVINSYNDFLQKKKWEPVDTVAQASLSMPGKIESTVSGLKFTNDNNTVRSFRFKKKLVLEKPNTKAIRIVCKGDTSNNASGYLSFNGWEVSINGEAVLPITPPQNILMEIVVNAESSCLISNIVIYALDEDWDLTESLDKETDVLVVAPSYPSYKNLYLSAFAHARNRAYIESGLRIQVAALSNLWYSMDYSINGVPVYCGKQADLKKLLQKKQYKIVVIHFIDEELLTVLDGYASNEKLIFICHGPETLFEVLQNKVRPYFTKPLPARMENERKRKLVTKYAEKDNVQWVFVSEWLKRESEKILGTKFKNGNVIGNFIDERVFKYNKKDPEDRKKILIIRKMDNICQHSVDQVVLAIRELSRRPFFNDLQFSVYGDGNYYDELLDPIKEFSNVSFFRTFLPHKEIANVHKKHGILLIPSRHDAHAVSMSEGASSGLVVIGSNVTSNPYFMDDRRNHTMVDPEDYVALADVIERLYYNPKEFLEISKRLSDFVHTVSSKENTIDREIDLIKHSLLEPNNDLNQLSRNNDPATDIVLTILVAAYNVEPWIEKCLRSLINHDNSHYTEVLVVNDGSKDRTSEIAHRYEKYTNGIVRVVDKENGGHGSTINIGIEEAKGRYFKIVDGDDWVDSEALFKLVEYLKNETADVVLTEGSHEYYDQTFMPPIIEYNMLNEGTEYCYDDLLFPNYGFDYYGPLLPTATYKTDKLREANFKLSEKKPYVDMEFNAFSQRYLKTLKYYKLDIYRYLIGREGQTVSREFWKSKYQVHSEIIFNILETLDKMEDFPENRRSFLYKHLIAMMVDSQIFMYDQVSRRDEIDEFLNKLGKWPEAKKASIDYIKKKEVESWIILQNYKKYSDDKPIILQDGRQRARNGKSQFIKKLAKAATPYGIVELRRRFLSINR